MGFSSGPSVVSFTQALIYEPRTQICIDFLSNRPLSRGLRVSLSAVASVLELVYCLFQSRGTGSWFPSKAGLIGAVDRVPMAQ